ncbi:TDP-N-acetylfucosamine:lipid II N-acetylfucosaminyltransferase [Metabacillus halosaccharovorans]|uniref:TDP-N-acetylfucosamine:lipid II N-acetylfucosaminyltransferase n=1 Tax=Metabacillus halosaccharovorans TaxID=930124 RepID=A0ABT3DC94_9BACI|nr:TDP-N-acetylfucosamine:lipid II N-acetylfucosaminyltransferase [Metabacillus halosaccharovorans]MCV9884673.1 TDP-N-acetylfucosamine:lipid II N-acetylfucosaminyltransferase [Metabacillus halosaccharovorans]
MTKTFKLSICMIVKDEEKNLNRCLNSLQTLLDQGYTELIIVDTGSTDCTVEIAKEYTEKVYFHKWSGNFSEMRNISISYASGDWIFIMDADEELENPSEVLSLFDTKKIEKYNTVQIKEKNIVSLQTNKIIYHVQERFFKNDGSFQYKGTIHNQPIYKEPVLLADIWLKHYGYVNEDKELMNRKFERTATILLQELEKDPDNIYYRFQLSRSYAMKQDFLSAYNEIKKAHKIMMKKSRDVIINHYYVFGEYARMCYNINKYDEVIEISDEGLKYKPKYLDLHFFRGHAELYLKKANKGIEDLEIYLDLAAKYIDGELNLNNQDAIELYAVDSLSFDSSLERVVSTIYNQENKEEDLLKRSDIDKLKEYINLVSNNNLQYNLIIKLAFSGSKFEYLINYYRNLSEQQKYLFIVQLEQLKKELNEETSESIERVFSGIDDNYGHLNKIRTEIEKNKLLVEFLNKYNFEYFTDELIQELSQYYIEYGDIKKLFKLLSKQVIKKIVKLLLDNKTNNEDIFLDILDNELKFEDFQNNRIFLAISNVILLDKIEKMNRIEKIDSRLERIFLAYIRRGSNYIKELYNKSYLRLLYNTLDNLEDKFLILISLAYEYAEKEDYKSFIKYTNEAAKEYPYFSKLLPIIIKDVYQKKAKMMEEKEDYLTAIETYEEIINLDMFNPKEFIEYVENLEKRHRGKILDQLNNRGKRPDLLKNYKYNNVHLIIDSPHSAKFLEFVNQNFDQNLHEFLLVTDNGNTKYVKNTEKANLTLFTISEKTKIIDILKKSKMIFVHYLLDCFCDLLINPDIDGTLNWAVWGGDLYNNIDFKVYGPDTQDFLNSNNIPHSIQKANFSVKRRRALRKMDFILTSLSFDYKLIVENYITVASQKEFSYPVSTNIEYFRGVFQSFEKINSKEITFLLGNSGDPTNNHIEILTMLGKYSGQKFKVIVPLSYGNPLYVEKLIEKGKEILGDCFIPITEFLVEEKYNQLLKKVDVAFMNHKRQQAVGNLILLLSLNTKIYMNRNSPLYQHYVNRGFKLFDIKEVDNNMEFDSLISKNFDYISNKELIQDLVDPNTIKALMEEVFV